MPILSLTHRQPTCSFQKYKLLQSSGLSIDELKLSAPSPGITKVNLLWPSAGQVATALGQLQTISWQPVLQPSQLQTATGYCLPNGCRTRCLNGTNLVSKLVDILNTVDDTTYQQKITDNTNFLLNLRLQYHDAFLTVDWQLCHLTTTTPAVPIAFPAPIAAQLTFDQDKRQLRLNGYMSVADKNALIALSTTLLTGLLLLRCLTMPS